MVGVAMKEMRTAKELLTGILGSNQERIMTNETGIKKM
jgi:hypothetical protein